MVINSHVDNFPERAKQTQRRTSELISYFLTVEEQHDEVGTHFSKLSQAKSKLCKVYKPLDSPEQFKA